ncbi:MAG: ferritin family protein [Dehalococcoidia bacterium]|nr:ferritin family protein [Dehalococcoidia bacterium]
MEDEQARTLEVLQSALNMEVQGKEFYRKASQESSNRLARELFERLADEEDLHRQKFEEIYAALQRGQNWPDIEPPRDHGRKLKSLFAEATAALGGKIEVAESELEAIELAMDMEARSYKLYHSRGEESAFPAERRFYEALAAEEQGHRLALVDSYEYLKDPAGWFTRSERWSLDGA